MRHHLQQIRDQVHELVREETWGLILRVSLPEQVSSVHGEQLVVAVFLKRCIEWGMASTQSEQDYACCKQINDVALVVLTLQNFRCHVGRCAQVGAQESTSITTLQGCGKPKVSNLNIELAI